MTLSRTGYFLLFFLISAFESACGDAGAPDSPEGGAGGSGAEGIDSGSAGAATGSGGTGGTSSRDAGGSAGSAAAVDARTDMIDVNSGQDGAPRTDGGGRADSGGAIDAGASGDGSSAGWNLIWNDEFNAASGTGADTSKWNLVNKGDGFGNNELEYYTNRTTNAYHDGNGFLVIKVIKEAYMGRQYTSARLESNGKFQHLYGRYEARLQLPSGQGIWPAFWMLGNNIGSAGWPTCGEIDVMENIGREPSTNHGSLHGPGYSGGNPLGQAYTLPNGEKFADGFHVFAIEWEQNVIRFYVDEILYGTKTPADAPSGARWVYDHPFYLLLNVAVGGTWPGSPDSTTTFPQTMVADYVRVYSR